MGIDIKPLNSQGEEFAEEDFNCPKHGIYRGRKYIIFPNIPSSRLCIPECPECSRERDRIKVRDMEAQKTQREISRLKAMNVGKRFWGESFETFNAYTDELNRHLETAKVFANDPRGRKLVMIGEHGNGKNHLAIAVLKVVGGVIHSAYEIGAMLRQSYNGETREWKVLQKLCGKRLLVIDEIEKIKGSEWDHNWMSYIINKRHENLLPTIFISNCHLKEDCQTKAGCQKCLENNLTDDVLSRITEDGLIMKFTAKDYRLINRKTKYSGGD